MKPRAAILLCALLLSACQYIPFFSPTPTPTYTLTPTPTCDEQSVDYLTAVGKNAREWDDAVAIAEVTSRIALAQPVANLQKIRRDFDDILYPPCKKDLRDKLSKDMKDVIDLFLTFMLDPTPTLQPTRNTNLVTPYPTSKATHIWPPTHTPAPCPAGWQCGP